MKVLSTLSLLCAAVFNGVAAQCAIPAQHDVKVYYVWHSTPGGGSMATPAFRVLGLEQAVAWVEESGFEISGTFAIAGQGQLAIREQTWKQEIVEQPIQSVIQGLAEATRIAVTDGVGHEIVPHGFMWAARTIWRDAPLPSERRIFIFESNVSPSTYYFADIQLSDDALASDPGADTPLDKVMGNAQFRQEVQNARAGVLGFSNARQDLAPQPLSWTYYMERTGLTDYHIEYSQLSSSIFISSMADGVRKLACPTWIATTSTPLPACEPTKANPKLPSCFKSYVSCMDGELDQDLGIADLPSCDQCSF